MYVGFLNDWNIISLLDNYVFKHLLLKSTDLCALTMHLQIHMYFL